MPDEIPRTATLTTRDRALSVKLQHKGIDAIGGARAIIPLDTCHCLMVSKLERLAEILLNAVGCTRSPGSRLAMYR